MIHPKEGRRKLPAFYPDTEVAISSPFYCVECKTCGNQSWSVFAKEKCAKCGSSVLCYPANEKRVCSDPVQEAK